MLILSYKQLKKKNSDKNDDSNKIAGRHMSLLASPPFETQHQTAAVAQGHHKCKYLGDSEKHRESIFNNKKAINQLLLNFT